MDTRKDSDARCAAKDAGLGSLSSWICTIRSEIKFFIFIFGMTMVSILSAAIVVYVRLLN